MEKRRQKIIIYYKNLPASVFAMCSPTRNMEAGMRHDRPFLCAYFCLLRISYHKKETLRITFMKYRAISLFLPAL